MRLMELRLVPSVCMVWGPGDKDPEKPRGGILLIQPKK